MSLQKLIPPFSYYPEIDSDERLTGVGRAKSQGVSSGRNAIRSTQHAARSETADRDVWLAAQWCRRPQPSLVTRNERGRMKGKGESECEGEKGKRKAGKSHRRCRGGRSREMGEKGGIQGSGCGCVSSSRTERNQDPVPSRQQAAPSWRHFCTVDRGVKCFARGFFSKEGRTKRQAPCQETLCVVQMKQGASALPVKSSSHFQFTFLLKFAQVYF